MATSLASLKRLKFSQVELLVDGFQFKCSEVKHYVLTHFHSDHTVGLSKSFGGGIIYCTPETREMVVQIMGVDPQIVHSIALLESYEVEGVRLTFLDAGHCPGSAIVVFEDLASGRLIVHTGDLRASLDIRESLCRWLGERVVHELYLDTTYCSPRWAFPDQQIACDWMQSITLSEIERDPETLFVVGSYQIGKEKAARAVAEAVKSSVFVEERRWKTIKCAGWGSETLSTGLPLWSVDESDCRVWMTPLGGLSHDVLLHHLDSSKGRFRSIVAFRPTGWAYSRGMSRNGVDAIKPWLGNDGRSRVYAVPYSEHSSVTELRDLVAALRPRRVVPTVNAESRAAKERVMAPLLGLLDLRSDRERLDHYFNGNDSCEPEGDLDGLVDVLAMSAGGGTSSASSNTFNTSVPAVQAERSNNSCDPRTAFSRLKATVTIDVDSTESSDGEVQHMESCGNNAGSCEAVDPELRQVDIAQQKRLLSFYEAVQSSHDSATKRVGKLKPVRWKGKNRNKDKIVPVASSATVAALLGAKFQTSNAKAKSGGKRGKRKPMVVATPKPKRQKAELEAEATPEKGLAEKRATRFSPKPNALVRERIERAFAHRLYLLDQHFLDEKDGVWFDVLGSTCNVYRVTLSLAGNDCQCPDFAKRAGVCKHLLFVALRVLKLERNDHRVWQTSLTCSELRPLLASVQENSRAGNNDIIADVAVMRGYRETRGDDDSVACTPRRSLPDDCAICFDTIEQSEQADQSIANCRSCGHYLHADCQRRWAASSPNGNMCPLCRSPWELPSCKDENATNLNLATYSAAQIPSLEELYPNTHQWITGRGSRSSTSV